MKNDVSDLFAPIQVGPYTLRNRIVMAPMTRSRAGPGGIPQPLNALHYEQRATAGLIITEASQVSPQGVGYPWTPGMHTPEQAQGWKLVTDAVHAQGGLIFLQLFHCGRISLPFFQPDGAAPVAPSPVPPKGEAWTPDGMKPLETPQALETDEIAGIVEQFRSSADLARTAGFDGVEIHAANGYLPDQFLQDGTNQRTDRYGGSLENRARFVLEVTEAVLGVWGAERVGIHLSPGNPFNSMHDSDPEALFSHLVEKLNLFGLAYLSISEIDLANPGDHKMANYNAALNAVTGKLRKIFSGVYMTNGGYDGESAAAVLASGDADLVSFGRPFIANPDLPKRLAVKAPLLSPDYNTFYGGSEKGYTDYPFLMDS